MHNLVYLIGRIVDFNEDGINIAVPRTYKNLDGIYETDFFKIIVNNPTYKEYCQKGDLIGIKGRIENRDNVYCIIADKTTFLSNNKGE